MNQKKIFTIISIILIINLTLIIYISSFNNKTYNTELHKELHSKYKVYDKFPDVDKINSDILLYLQDKGVYDKTIFNQREIVHLKDVKDVIHRMNVFYYSIIIISVILISLLFFYFKKTFFKKLSFILFFTGLATLVSTILILLLLAVNFNNTFAIFHTFFFEKETWLFNNSDNLINIYPSGFFFDISKAIFLRVVYFANILIGVGVLLSIKKW